MAEAKKADAAAEAPAAPPKKKKLLLFIIIGVLVLVLGGGAAVFLLKKKPAEEGEDGDEAPKKEAKHKKSEPAKPPSYLKLDTFTTNLMPESPDQTAAQYIQVVVELKVGDPHEAETIKQFMPEIRDRILRLLSGRKPSQLAPLEGKDTLAQEIRDSVNLIVNPPAKKPKSGKVEAPEEPVLSVHFSSFIIQ
ncbi:MAG TPA: flagellar basal body-associated FliL family protein [Rhodocyclaceae bacterium]|nr:flagellar basal body-associated FliL family protein [Rhodocyclaceae bacterium]